MNYYHLRTDISTISTDALLAVIQQDCPIYASCIEGYKTNNPHMHFYLETTLKNPTLRVHMRTLGLKGNGSYSLKKCQSQPVELLAYMMKEKRYDFSRLPSDLVEQVEAHQASVVSEMKKKKELRVSVVDRLAQLVAESDPPLVENGVMNDLGVQILILQYHKDNNLLVRKFQLQAYFHTLQLRFTDIREMTNLFI